MSKPKQTLCSDFVRICYNVLYSPPHNDHDECVTRNYCRNHHCPSTSGTGTVAGGNEVESADMLAMGGRGDLPQPLLGSPVLSPAVSPTTEAELAVLNLSLEDGPRGGQLSMSNSTGSRSKSYPFENHVVDYSSPANSRLAGEMIDGVRNTTGLSHEMSQIAVQTVLEFLQSNFTEMAAPLNSLMAYLEAPCAIRNFPDIIRQSPDAAKLKELFSVLTECKEDEQQRSWSLHEDEKMILGTIAELNAILTNADHSISKYVMQESQYTSVHAIALYYQMETRRSIRQVLRDSCAFISIIDKKAMNVLANSVLPMELAREMLADATDKTKLYSAASLLCILLSSGEPMPVTHYEHLGSDFITVVLNAIESNSPEDDERLVDTLISLVLAYNLQFQSPDFNFSIQALSQMTNAPHFTQRIIYLLNWGKDPVSDEMPFNTCPVNSVCKLLIDMFCCSLTANLFYTNDVKVLIDIIIRNLTDLGAGDKKKSSYLTLIRMILRNTKYQEYQHRKDDLSQCFTTVLLEDDPMSVPDQRLIREIYLEFPLLNK